METVATSLSLWMGVSVTVETYIGCSSLTLIVDRNRSMGVEAVWTVEIGWRQLGQCR